MSTISLKNQRIVIIGGSSGIGLATAKQAVEQGAAVIIAGRSQDKLENAQQLLGFDSVEIHSLDNQNEQDLKAFFEKIGAFDHLFTPGASYVRGPITSSLGVAHNCFNAKFWPQYNAVKHAIPFINPTGSIVLMSGAFSQRPLADGASYAACNGAIESLGKALAVELAPMRVNVISPGTIHTNFNWEGAEQETRDKAYDEYTNINLLGRVGHADEAAHTTIYLMTNGYTTGSTLFPDGGYILR
ncbi:dehydrogenase [Paenibacillus odorifer]|uniref:Dehydrogenase n=1 Tax=Paenibacillus odorifer TaxID=189426 RepID=A0A1R0XCJ0_9BACL|nr:MULTISPECIES: SDR family oxidoreductase [Paenibacillus]ETT49569.1 dehydrogenase [Paenibacillus sp. FSL H8-237]OMD32772.1 dehydrogenase [Paenibacillus odorifer]OME63281.1 dehydrogenase [Paenibacillus odorifer]